MAKRVSLKLKLLIAVMLSSGAATTVTTIGQLTYEYFGEKSKLEDDISAFENGVVQPLQSAFWSFDEKAIMLQMNSALKIKPMMALVIKNNKGIVQFSARRESNIVDNYLQVKTYDFRGDNDHLFGVLEATYTEYYVVDYIRSRFISIIVINFAKSLVVSFILLWVFQRILVNPVLSIVNFFKTHEIMDPMCEKDLNQIHVSDSEDELHDLRQAVSNAISVAQQAQRDVIMHQIIAEKERSSAISSARMAEIGNMASGIAHEINNPLSVIIGHVDNAMRKLGNNTAVYGITTNFERIRASVRRIADIVRGLRVLSRDGGEDAFEYVKIKDILNDIEPIAQIRNATAKVDFRILIHDDEVEVYCRHVQLSQVIINIINNAFDAIDKLPEKWILVEAEQSASGSIIRITDSGNGIDSETAESIFKPYFTTKPVGQGTGIGLSISQNIIKMHQGELSYVKRHGHTSFEIFLPKLKSQTN